MYKSVWEFVRPSEEVPFPPKHAVLNQLREAAAGFIGKEVLVENNGLTKRIKMVWNSEEDAMNFMQANSEVIAEANGLLITYCENNNIFATRTIE